MKCSSPVLISSLVILTILCGGQCDALDLWEFLIGPRVPNTLRNSNTSTVDQRITEQTVKNFGYRLDTHLVASETGHIITLHRISKGRNGTNPSRPIAFIHHGLLGSSDMWLLRGPEHDLPYLLADSDYDVWLFNMRGNVHSRKHKTLDPDRDAKYWDFGLEEVGLYDLPATFDYILSITNQEKLFFLGHSIGCSTALIMCTLRPEYNAKIKLFLGLGPLVSVKHSLNPVHKIFFSLGSALLRFVKSQNIFEIFPRRMYITKILALLCKSDAPTHNLCLNLIFTLVGSDYGQFNTSSFPDFLRFYPAGTSGGTLINVVQYYLTGKFTRNDSGKMLNVLYYNESSPPSYNLEKVTVPVSLYYGDGDALVPEQDVLDLGKQLPNVVGNFKIPYEHFNHLDFVLAINARKLLYENLLEIMYEYK